MLAGGSSQYPRRRHHHHSGTPSPLQPPPLRESRPIGEGGDDALRQSTLPEMRTNVHGSGESDALAAERGTRTLPRDASTCTLWCAISLGALVRGHPLAQVRLYGVYVSPFLSAAFCLVRSAPMVSLLKHAADLHMHRPPTMSDVIPCLLFRLGSQG